MPQNFDNSQQSIERLIQASQKFFTDHKIETPFELDTMFRILENRVRDGGYTDNILLNGLEKEIRVLYHTFSALDGSAELDKTALAGYGVPEAVQSKAVTANIKTSANELKLCWQQVAGSRSVDLGLRVAEYLHPDKETFANLAQFVHEHHQQIYNLHYGGLMLLGPPADAPLPNRVAADPLGGFITFLHALEDVTRWEEFYASGKSFFVSNDEEKARDRMWKRDTLCRDNLPRGDETMDKFLEMIDQVRAANPNMPASTEQTLNNIYNAVADLRQAYTSTGITTKAISPPPTTQPIDRLINFAKRLASPKQPKDTPRELDQNDITGSSGLGKLPPSPGQSSDDTPQRS